MSTPANSKQTPKPRRGDRENSVGVTSVSSVERFRRSRELIKKEEKKSFKSVLSVGDKTSQSDKNSVRNKTSVRDETLEIAIQRIEQRGIDVTAHYHDWYRIGMALASHYGEAGRDYYHRISRYYPRYTADETNKQYDRCLRYNTHRIHLGTLFYLIQSTDNR